jgi:hypothetical protein
LLDKNKTQKCYILSEKLDDIWCGNGKKPQKIFVAVGCLKLGVKIMSLSNKTVQTMPIQNYSSTVTLSSKVRSEKLVFWVVYRELVAIGFLVPELVFF